MKGFRSGRSGSRSGKAGARAAFRAIGKATTGSAARSPPTRWPSVSSITTAPLQNKPRRISEPRLWWKGAAKQTTRPCRVPPVRKKRKSGETATVALPWVIPKPDAEMWADYQACKAAGLLGAWFERYRDVLNLQPSMSEPIP